MASIVRSSAVSRKSFVTLSIAEATPVVFAKRSPAPAIKPCARLKRDGDFGPHTIDDCLFVLVLLAAFPRLPIARRSGSDQSLYLIEYAGAPSILLLLSPAASSAAAMHLPNFSSHSQHASPIEPRSLWIGRRSKSSQRSSPSASQLMKCGATAH